MNGFLINTAIAEQEDRDALLGSVGVGVRVGWIDLQGAGDALAQSVVLESAELGTTGRIGGTSTRPPSMSVGGFKWPSHSWWSVSAGASTYPDVPGEIFAALVRLSVIDAFPQGSPFTAEEVVATTLFRPDFPSDEILTPLSAELDPGSYALVFGTGLFGATGEGAIHNGPDQPDIPPTELSSFIFLGIPNIGQPQIWRTNLASNTALRDRSESSGRLRR